MNLIYPALALHSAGKEINEENLSKVVEATGADVDESQIKALVAALEDVDIEEAMEKSVATVAPAQPSTGGKEEAAESEAEDEEEAKEEEEESASEDEAAEGLGSLF